MREFIDIIESFDTYQGVEWLSQTSTEWKSINFINNIEVIIGFSKMINSEADEWSMMFQTRGKDGYITTVDTGLIGANAIKVFSLVIHTIDDFLEKVSPDYLHFGSSKSSKKSNLYVKMADALQAKLQKRGYDIRIVDGDIEMEFTIKRLHSSLNESSQIPNNLTFYHRSRAGSGTLKQGFNQGERGDYGHGVYGIMDWRYIEKTSEYGSNIFRCHVPNVRILCLDTEFDPTPITEQLDRMNVHMTEFRCHGFSLEEVQDMLYENNYAHNFAPSFVYNGVFDQINGMLFNHVTWGRMVVIRARELITLDSWVSEFDIKKDLSKVKFKQI